VRLSARLKSLSNRFDDHSAGGRWFYVTGLLTAKLCCPVAVQARGTVECQSLQITDADDLR